jgi:hypothetical protein
MAASRAQTTSTPVPLPPAKPSPGDPLPDFPEVKLDYSKGSVTAEQDAEGLRSIVATGGVTLTFGDLRIQADKITYASGSRFIDATGNVLVTRGDESLRGERFTFSGIDGAAAAERTVIISPPFYISSEQFLRDARGTVIRNARIVPSPDGKGEVSLSAREIQLETNSRRAILRDMTLRLFGARLLTLRHVRIPVGLNRREDEEERSRLSLPLTFRVSGITGAVVGVQLPIRIDDRTTGDYGIDFTQRTSTQYLPGCGVT